MLDERVEFWVGTTIPGDPQPSFPPRGAAYRSKRKSLEGGVLYRLSRTIIPGHRCALQAKFRLARNGLDRET